MTKPQRKYEAVDWHGENLRIDQDENGYVTISRPPFETVFNPCEMEEISQFINGYCASHSSAKESSDKVEPIGMNSTDIMLLAHDEWKRREERKHTHPEEHWVPGFINGFLTDKKWARECVKKFRKRNVSGND